MFKLYCLSYLSSSDYLICPYYSGYHPSDYHIVINVDNREDDLLLEEHNNFTITSSRVQA